MGAQPGYGGIRIFNNEDLGSRIASFGETDSHVRIDNVLFVYGDARAPIFYDQNDTGGYIDPNSAGNGFRFWSGAGWWQLRGATHWDSQPGIDLSGGTSEFRISSTGGNANLRVDGWMFAYDSSYFPFIYDTNDSGYYLDPNGTSNLARFTQRTHAAMNRGYHWITPRFDYTGDVNYWTGTFGWGTSAGTWANAWKSGFAGWDIWGGGTDHPQGGGYVHAQGIVSGQHYATSDGGQAYGWQMVGAADAGSRWWLRGKWGGTTYPWYEIVLYGRNVGGGDIYAGYWYDGNNTGYYVNPDGSSQFVRTYVNDWFRAQGNCGIYWESYGGGWWMTDGTWIRSYNSRNVYCDTYIRAQGSFRVGSEYSIWGNYGSYSSYISRIFYFSFDWNATYDSYTVHGIASTDLNGSPSDSVSINSFNDIMLRIDANDNNGNSYVRFMDNTSGNNQFAYIGREGGNSIAYFDNRVYGAIFYDSNDSSYYMDPNSTSDNCARFAGGIWVSRANGTGSGIILADDGDIVDLNDGYCAMRFSFGVRIHSANRGGGAVIALRQYGGIIASDNIIAYGSPSDARKKENVVPIENALEKVTKLRGVEFDWKEDTDEWQYTKIKHDIGFIAQEVQAVEPTLVREGGDGFLGVRDRGIPALLVEAVKELKQQLDDAKAEIKELKEQLLKK